MTEILFVSAALLVGWYILYFLIPWMAKRATVYGLHGLRDRLHAAFVRCPDLRDSTFYRDMDYLLAQDVRYARDKGYFEFAKRAMWRYGPPRVTGNRRPYAADMAALARTATGREATQELFSIFDGAAAWNLIRLLFGHPAVLPLSVPFVLALFFVATYRTLMPSVPDEAKLATALKDDLARPKHGPGLRIA